MPEKSNLFPKGKVLDSSCACSAGFMDLCLLLVPICLYISFRGPPWQYLIKTLYLFLLRLLCPQTFRERDNRLSTCCNTNKHIWNDPHWLYLHTISSLLYAPQASASNRELKAPYLPSLSVDKAFFFPSHQQSGCALELRRQQFEVFLVLAPAGREGLWHY